MKPVTIITILLSCYNSCNNNNSFLW
jgi:hypothetical protein